MPPPVPVESPYVFPTVSPTPEITPIPIPSPTNDPLQQPPPGIQPTKATLPQVLQRYQASLGQPAQHVSSSREADAMTGFGLAGSHTEVQSGQDYVETTTLGPATTQSGRVNGQKWEMNQNGYVRLITGIHQEDDVSAQAIRRSLSGLPSEYVKLLGQVDAPIMAYVVEVNPPRGRHEWYFFDRTTGRLVRLEEARVDRRVAFTYDDFRTTNGMVEPWHVHRTDGYDANTMDWRTTSLKYNGTVAPSELSMPSSRTVVEFPTGVTSVRLPARRDGSKIVVRVTIGSRGLDLILDSGSAGIVIDRDVVKQLGLTTFGESTESVAGTFERSSAIVPDMRIGSLAMHNVIVDSLPMNYQAGYDTRIVGLLGYDFLAGVVAKIDYLHGTVDAIAPGAFRAPEGRVFETPIALDDAIPMVEAGIGDSMGANFGVDTGSSEVVVFSKFAETHAADVPLDLIKTPKGMTMYAIVAGGVGGTMLLVPSSISAFQFAGLRLTGFVVFRVVAAPSFEGEDTDGLIGYEFLALFDVYLDYPDGTLLLQINRLGQMGT